MVLDFRCFTKSVVEFYDLVQELRDEFSKEIISVDSMIIFSWEKIRYG